MGLDSYSYAIKEENLPSHDDADVKTDDVEKESKEEVFYWRKHHELHDWMQNLYYSKGGSDPMFNCNNVRVYSEDLDELEKIVLSGGFDADRIDEDVEFITKARKFSKDGYAVFYDSWW